MATDERTFMSLDLGSKWIKAAAGSVSADGRLVVHGVNRLASQGIRCGTIINIEDVISVTRRTVTGLLSETRIEPDSLVVGIGGSQIEYRQSNGVIGITGREEIDRVAIEKAVASACTVECPPHQRRVHALVQDFSVDGARGIRDPLNMLGHRIESNVMLVYANESNCSNVEKAIERCGYARPRLMLSTLADADAVLTSEEKEIGTILIDIGANTTSMIAYCEGSPVYVGAVDMGGESITSDIATLFQMSKTFSEQLKTKYGSCYPANVPEREFIEIPQIANQPTIKLPKREFAKIIEPRMAEILTILYDQFREKNIHGSFGNGIVLVGGGSMLSGVPNLVSDIFDHRPSRITYPKNISGYDSVYPEYCEVIGLLQSEARAIYRPAPQQPQQPKVSHENNTGIKKGLRDFFKTLF